MSIAWIVSVISMGPSATDVDLRVWLIVNFGVWTIFQISTVQPTKRAIYQEVSLL